MIKSVIKKIEIRGQEKVCLGIDIMPGDKLLIVSPHPDDESIGCGGLIAQYASQCDVLLITDGGTGNPEWSYEKTAEVRSREFQNTMRMAAVNKSIQLKCRCGEYRKLRRTKIGMDLSVYQHIFIPNSRENHIEHKIVHQIIIRAVRQQHIHSNVYEYEVWTPMYKITNYLDISQYKEKKVELISNYKCQLKHIDYISAIIGLNCYRGMQYHIRYAEGYKKYKGICSKMIDRSCGVLSKGVPLLYRIHGWLKGKVTGYER